LRTMSGRVKLRAHSTSRPQTGVRELMKIDCHVHPIGLSNKSGCYLSPRMLRSIPYRFILFRFGLTRVKDPEERERVYLKRLVDEVEESEIDRAVLLAFDEVHAPDGSPDRRRTNVIVPNDFVLDICGRHPSLFLFGASVHPYRRDALDELERVASNGAQLVKLLPNSHGFDPADPRIIPYYRKLADLKLPLLVHCGYEHTIPPIDQSLGDPRRLKTALDQGATVIVAHAGTAGLTHPKETLGSFLEILTQYPNCFGDTSALTNFWRAKYLKDLLDPERILRKYKVHLNDPMSRMIHGSDYPIPVTPFAFHFRLAAGERRSLKKQINSIQKDVEIKRLLGVADACLTRAHDELGIGKK
jgi:predicted TIM-barrel fold metal-dependent hydrolase